MGGVVSALSRRRRRRKDHTKARPDEEERPFRRGSSALKRLQRSEIKLLVLGTSEAGKSTFVKQLRVVHGEGFSDDERRARRHLVRSSVYSAAQSLIAALGDLGECLPANVTEQARPLTSLSLFDIEDMLESDAALPDEHVEAIQAVWREPVTRACLERRTELSRLGHHIPQSSVYFLDNLERLAGENYIPTLEDMLRVRLPTTGIHEYRFMVEKTPFRVFDVGGQRSDRRKWVNRFEGVGAIIFVCAISEYDQTLAEDNTTNRLSESLALFKALLAIPSLKDCTVILFLNKTDLFAERLLVSDFSDFFPEYTGPEKNAEKVGMFILNLFARIGSEFDRTIYAHFTCATDTQNMKVVFEAVKDSVLQDSLRQASLIPS